MIPAEDINTTPVFFILGRPRSGTTLLASLFDAHPNVCMPFECPFIINLYKKYYKVITWDENTIRTFCADILEQRKFDSWRVDADTLIRNLLEYKGKHDFEFMVKAVYLHFNSFFKKENIVLIGDKNPVYSIYSDVLIKLFPKAKFIHLTRDFRDNILSIQKVDFEAPFTSLLAYRWRYATKKILETQKKYEQQFYQLRYEDLVAAPKKEMMALCRFLQIDFIEDVLNFHKIGEELFKSFDKEHIMRYHSSLLRPITADKIFAWKKTMALKDLVQANKVVGELLCKQTKYQWEKPALSPLQWLKTCIGITYGYLAYLLRFGVDCLPHRTKQRIRNRGPLLAVLYNRLTRK